MWDAPAKALARDFFYKEYLPSKLPLQMLRNVNYLVLLGDSEQEEDLLEFIGVPDHRVFSVENNEAVFLRQSSRVRRGDLKALLYYGELTEFIDNYLYSNQRFRVFNLDICGFYKTCIDPVMTPVLIFARRNPQTVMATYSNVGRDRTQLYEGLKSLAICYWLDPEQTKTTVDTLYGRYLTAGMKPDTSFNMVLRHLFWLRSHLEHIVLGRVAMGTLPADLVEGFLADLEDCWQTAKQVIKGKPVRYDTWLRAVDNCYRPGRLAKLCDLGIKDVTILTYDAVKPFYHTGWFCEYQPIRPVNPTEWMTSALTALIAQPLYFADEFDEELRVVVSKAEPVSAKQIVWQGKQPVSLCRELEIPVPDPQLAAVGKTMAKLIEPEISSQPEADTTPAPTPEETLAKPKKKSVKQSLKQLSELQKDRIRALARAEPNLNTGEVITKLRLYGYARSSITAHIAGARRGLK